MHHRDRILRSRRRGLNPAKIVFIYVLAFLLVAFHQAGRVAEWFDDLALSHDGPVSETAFHAAAVVRHYVLPYGPAQINQAWDRVLALTVTRPRVAARSGARPGPVFSPEAGAEGASPGSPPGRTSEGGPETPGGERLALARPSTDPGDLAAPARVFNPGRVLLLGDSMMLEGLGPQLQRELKKNEGLTVFRDGRYGTGLTRLDNFDWLSYFDQMLDKYDPDLIIITLGANDPQDMVDTGRRVSVGTEAWNANYAARVADLLSRARDRGMWVFWVGLPVMGREPYGERVANINRVTAEACGAAVNCRFWDGWLSVADAGGQYATFLPDGQGKSVRIRAKDFIHLTEDGGRLMAEKFLAETAGWVDYRQKKPADGGGPAAPAEPAPLLAPSAGESDEGAAAPAPVVQERFFSRARGRETTYFVAAPSAASKRPGAAFLPVVFLLHGAWDGGGDWSRRLGAPTLAAWAERYGLILVMPDGEPFGWYLDGRETAIETYLTAELIPHFLAAHPEADGRRMGLVGLSMGGHGALTLTLKHPDLFKAAGSLSGVTDLSAHAEGAHPVDRRLRIDRVLGPAGEGGNLWRPYGAMGLTEARPEALAGRPLILGVGRDDRLTLAENRAYHQLLTELGVEHVYRETVGGHDWVYWSSQLPVQLEFMAGHLRAPEGADAGAAPSRLGREGRGEGAPAAEKGTEARE